MLQASVVHDQHDQIHAFYANLKTRASAAYGDKSGSAPASLGAATADTASVLGADNESAFDQIRDDEDTFCGIQHFFGDAFVGRCHDFLEHVGSLLQPFDGVLTGRSCPAEAGQSYQT